MIGGFRIAAKIRDKYDVDAGSYDSLYRNEQISKLNGLIDAGWLPADRLIDIGCGTGLIACRIARRCDFAVGMDISLNMIRQGRRRKMVEYVVGDALHPPFRSECFTQGICITSFHHFPYKTYALVRMAEIIVRGGNLVVSLRQNLDEEASEAALLSCPALRLTEQIKAGKEILFLFARV